LGTFSGDLYVITDSSRARLGAAALARRALALHPAVLLGINPIVTLEKQRLHMIGNLV
jgi:hypothetical protein